MLHEKLKQETAQNHKSIEQNSLLKRVMSPTLNMEEYNAILTKFYVFHKIIEERLVVFNNSYKLLPDLNKRLKLNSIKLDIDETLLPYKALSIPLQNLEIKSAEAFFGVLYVIEGSTLGGQFIAPRLQKSLPGLGHRYYKGYANKTHEMWKSFLNTLSKNENQLNHKEVVKIANNTFQELTKLFV